MTTDAQRLAARAESLANKWADGHVTTDVVALKIFGASLLHDLAAALSQREEVDLRARDVLALCEAILAACKEDPTSTTEGAVYLAADVISRLTGQHNASTLVAAALDSHEGGTT